MTSATGTVSDGQDELEGFIKDEVFRMYEEVAKHPEKEFHFFHGRKAADMFGYETEWLDRCPEGAIASFAGVGNPHVRSRLTEGESVLDVGSGAGLDSMIAGFQVGASGHVKGVDFNPEMLDKARTHASEAGMSQLEFLEGSMEDIPVSDGSVGVIISNGVINLSFRKRRVIQELFRVLAPGGRISITDIVSARQLSHNVVKDPKLWAS